MMHGHPSQASSGGDAAIAHGEDAAEAPHTNGAPEGLPNLAMRGGMAGAVLPLLMLVAILIALSVSGGATTRAFWAGGWIALVVGLLLARDRGAYCNAVLRGLANNNGIVIVTAWLFAGVFGKLMVAGGLVQGLLWVGTTTGATGALFTVLAFLTSAIFALGTGTSTGMVLAMGPVLYPAGVILGADPTMLAAAILSGAAFGDNLAPISDTTIVSAYTQGATMRDVVRSRLPLSLSAAAIATGVLFVAGGNEGTPAALPRALTTSSDPSPDGVLMLLGFVVVVAAALSGRHLIESLIYGNISACALGMLTGRIGLLDVLHVPETRGESTGLIEDGISSVVAPIVFALLVLALTQILLETGVMGRILRFAERRIARSVRQAEAAIAVLTALVSIPIAANAPALLLVGPSFVQPLGARFKLAPARRANVMDCAVCTIFFMAPWHIAVAVWHGAIAEAAMAHGLPIPSVWVAALNPYSWALCIVLVFSITTGWNRRFDT